MNRKLIVAAALVFLLAGLGTVKLFACVDPDCTTKQDSNGNTACCSGGDVCDEYMDGEGVCHSQNGSCCSGV